MKKGFTLIELLAVLVIIGILAVITTPIVLNIVKTTREKADERQKEIIIKAAKNWGNDNAISIGNGTYIMVQYLMEDGYLKEVPKKQATEGTFNGCITIVKDENKYLYEYKETEAECIESITSQES